MSGAKRSRSFAAGAVSVVVRVARDVVQSSAASASLSAAFARLFDGGPLEDLDYALECAFPAAREAQRLEEEQEQPSDASAALSAAFACAFDGSSLEALDAAFERARAAAREAQRHDDVEEPSEL